MTDRQAQAQQIVKTYSTWSAAAGLIPIAAVDVAAIGGLQLKMISELAQAYDLPFKRDRGKALLSALLGGAVSTKLAYGAGGSLIKAIPVVGMVGGLIAMPAFGAAATYAVGQVFIQHFESGGTFLDFDPDKVREHFRQEFDRARA
jgi:uncharacterized protein (DUF697 family)